MSERPPENKKLAPDIHQELAEIRELRENEEVETLCRFVTLPQFLDYYGFDNKDLQISDAPKLARAGKLDQFIMPPTDCGFSVNKWAENYQTDILFELYLIDQQLKVKDLPGPQKFAFLQPSYVSTPPIFCYGVPRENCKIENGRLILKIRAQLLSVEDYKKIKEWIDMDMDLNELEELFEVNRDKKEDTVLGIFYLSLKDYIIKQKELKAKTDINI